MALHPGKLISIYEVAQLVGEEWPRAKTPLNISSGFRVSGISPLNRNIFAEEEFLTSAVTERPAPTTSGSHIEGSAQSEPSISHSQE